MKASERARRSCRRLERARRPLSAPTTLAVRAHATTPMPLIVCKPRQQLAGARRRNYVSGSVDPQLCSCSVVGQQHVKALAGVGGRCREDRWGISDAEKFLVEQDLSVVLRERLLDAVALDCAPVFGVETLMFPHCRIAAVRQLGASDDDAISMAA